MNDGKVTLYIRGEFLGNIIRIEARAFSFRVAKYAQFDHAIYAEFTPKGARRARGIVQNFAPSLLVLEGWGHPEPAEAFRTIRQDDDMTVSQSRYRSCDERWQSDFDALIGEHIAKGAKVVADFRGHNPHTGEKAAS